MSRRPTYKGLDSGKGESSSGKSKSRTLESDFEIAMRLQKASHGEENHGQSTHKDRDTGNGESSSSKTKMRQPDSDFEIALRLQQALDDEGYSQPVHRDLSARKDEHTHKNLFIRKDSSTHKDLPTHRDSSTRKDASTHKDQFIRKDSSTQKDLPTHKGERIIKDPFVRKDSSTHKDLPPHKDLLTRKDLPPRNDLPTRKELPASTSFGKTSNAVSRRDDGYPPAIQDAIDQVKRFAAKVMGMNCHVCNAELMRNFDVGAWYRKWISTKGQPEVPSICALSCPNSKCQALTCLGCGQKPQRGKFKGKIDGFVLDWCCDEGRLFAVWSLLSQYDNLELSMQERFSRREPPNSRPRGPPSSLQKGTGYNSSWEMVSYGRQGSLNFKQADSETDSSTKKILAFIIELLPHRSDKGKATTPTLGAMIELSLIQDRVAELLRNDSLQDTTKRAALYFAAFEFFERLGKHPEMSYLVYEERFHKKQSYGLCEISTYVDIKNKGNTRASSRLILGDGKDSTAASLVACMTNLATQSEALLAASRAVEREFRTTDGQDLLEVASRVAKLKESMKPNGAMDSKKSDAGDKPATWKEYHQQHGVARAENVLRCLSPKFKMAAQSLSYSPPNRIKRLVTEVSEMATSLPPNIFVRVDEIRPDVMMCLIVGPEGTPYEGGLFEFEIFCKQDYPQSPPLVGFRGTAGGRLSINPNLHADGKVCLSILGTWPGTPEEQWQGAKSSIFSVLVSIQAMILCPTPLENIPNFPGFSGNQNAQIQAQNYNKSLQGSTIRWAILEWLRKDQSKNVLWGSVVKKYFELNSAAILGRVSEWKRNNRQLEAYFETYTYDPRAQNFRHQNTVNLVRELEKALQPFQQTRR